MACSLARNIATLSSWDFSPFHIWKHVVVIPVSLKIPIILPFLARVQTLWTQIQIIETFSKKLTSIIHLHILFVVSAGNIQHPGIFQVSPVVSTHQQYFIFVSENVREASAGWAVSETIENSYLFSVHVYNTDGTAEGLKIK